MSAFLDVAATIARHIARSAIRHGGLCTWLGPDPGDERASGTLGPDLYGGLAGVGLVLCEAGTATADESLTSAGIRAMRLALEQARHLPGERRLGLYTGALGTVLAALRVERLTGVESIGAPARALGASLIGSGSSGRGRADLVGGRAGEIVGMLMLSRAMGEPRAEEHARATALRLESERLPQGGWESPSLPARAPLSGLSHGTAGIAYALALSARTFGAATERQGALLALADEVVLFDPESGNWPDRRDPESQHPESIRPRSRVFWCHGAPGSVIALLNAESLLGTVDPWRPHLLHGLETTRRWVVAATRTGTGNFSLCHGLAGSAEILADCARAGADSSLLEDATSVAYMGIGEHHREGSWPSGVGAGRPSPGLMTGLAGTCRFYLRMHDPSLPTVLLPAPSASWGDPA